MKSHYRLSEHPSLGDFLLNTKKIIIIVFSINSFLIDLCDSIFLIILSTKLYGLKISEKTCSQDFEKIPLQFHQNFIIHLGFNLFSFNNFFFHQLNHLKKACYN